MNIKRYPKQIPNAIYKLLEANVWRDMPKDFGEKSVTLGFFMEGKLVGAAIVQEYEYDPEFENIEDAAPNYITAFGIYPHMQRLGHGTVFAKELLSKYQLIELEYTNPDNKTFWQRLGFKPTQDDRCYDCKHLRNY